MATRDEIVSRAPARPGLPERLPQMTPRGLAVFTAIWFFALAAAVVAPLGGAWFRLATPAGAGAIGAVRIAIDLVPPLFLIAAAILLYRRRRRDVVAALLSLSFLLMAGGFFAAEAFFRTIELSWFRDLLAHAGRAILLLVLLTFPDGRFNPRWTLAVAALLLVWTPVALLGPIGLGVEYIGYLVFLALAVLAIALPYRRLESPLERQQIRWALLGFSLGTLLFALATAITFIPPGPSASLAIALSAQILAALGMVCFALGLIVSLLRYRLYDADAAASLSAGYAVLTLLLGAVFAVSAKGIELLAEAGFGRDAGALPGLVGAALAVIFVSPLHARVHDWAERRFQKDLLNLRRDLPECVADLRATGTLPELVEEVAGRVAAGVRAARAAILVGGEVAAARDVAPAEAAGWAREARLDADSGPLDCDRADPLFPMRIPLRIRYGVDAPLGWILLGPRPDGSFYGRDEREALAAIADPVARGVQIVLRREARERDLESRLSALERRLELSVLPSGGSST